MKEERCLEMSTRYKPETVVYSARNLVIRIEIAGPTKTGRRTGRQEIRTGNQFPAITLIKKNRYHVIAEVGGRTITLDKKDRYHMIAEVRGRTQGGEQNQGGGQMTKFMADIEEEVDK